MKKENKAINTVKEIDFSDIRIVEKNEKKMVIVDSMFDSAFEHIINSISQPYSKR